MITIRTHYYQQFDADPCLDVPGEGYGGWKTAELPLEPGHTAVVVMHAWDCGRREDYPGWHRAVEYIPRAQRIGRTVFPPLLAAVRQSPLPLFHVVSGGTYFQHLPGYRRATALAGSLAEEAVETVAPTQGSQALTRFRREHVFVGPHNEVDVQRGFENMDFMPEARPVGDEGIAENRRHLLALCRHHGINHLVYVGFAINWCILTSPAGMLDMCRHGLVCSTIRQAVTAVENKESARLEGHKEEALWRTALAFGFVYDADDFIAALRPNNRSKQ